MNGCPKCNTRLEIKLYMISISEFQTDAVCNYCGFEHTVYDAHNQAEALKATSDQIDKTIEQEKENDNMLRLRLGINQ